MSGLAATVSLGPAGWANGDQKAPHVVGHLYVGGSAMWVFHDLSETGGRTVMTLSSRGGHSLWTECAAALAMTLGFGRGDNHVEPAEELDNDVPGLRALASQVAELNVAAVLCLTTAYSAADMEDIGVLPGWSVQICDPTFERRHSRWDTGDGLRDR